jgi:hypothetical protein
MLETPLNHDKATLAPPEGPGLGIAIDKKALRKHGERFFAMDRKRLAFFAVRDRGIKAAREMDKTKRSRLEEKGS